MPKYGDQLREKIPAEYQEILAYAADRADHAGLNLVVVGGVVRDILLDRTIREVDLMMDPPARPLAEDLAQRFEGRLISHDAFHTFTIDLPSGSKLDLATAREETYRTPGALPDVFPSTVDKDLRRRDFTINAMLIFLNKQKYGELWDPFQGQMDLKQGLIRSLHAMSFVDDPTRIYRAARFASRFKFSVEKETAGQILKSVHSQLPHLLTPARRRREFELILKEDDPLPILIKLNEWGALDSFHPDWTLEPAHLNNLSSVPMSSGPSLLVHRLAMWFQVWGSERARLMMTDLSFEKKIKADVLRCIG